MAAQRVTAIVAAGAVLWHTVAGCCAHHAHAEVVGPAHHHAVGSATHPHYDDVGPAASCCGKSASSSRCGAAVQLAAEDASPEDRSGQCPCGSPAECPETECTFAAPNPPDTSTNAAVPWTGFYLNDALIDLASSPSLRQRAYPLELARYLDCALRRHLSVGVMLL